MIAFVEAIEKADADDAVKAIIVTGKGERAFCAGADLSRGEGTFDYASQGALRDKLKVNGIFRDWGGWMSLRLFNCLKPVIGALNGSAAGVGATLPAAMDFRLAVKHAKFVFPFVRRGIVPDAASSWYLKQSVGLPTALNWCLTGRQILADETLRKGFVESLHESEDLMPAARALAKEISENASPVAVALTRRMLWRMAGTDHPMEAHMADSRAITALGSSEDAKEGIKAFLEKRKPNFPSKLSTDMPDIFPHWEEPEFR
jgi:enoyl-CoA hydratase/carnithine racemase